MISGFYTCYLKDPNFITSKIWVTKPVLLDSHEDQMSSTVEKSLSLVRTEILTLILGCLSTIHYLKGQ